MSSRIRRIGAVTAATLVVVLAACGSDDGGDAEPTDVTEATVATQPDATDAPSSSEGTEPETTQSDGPATGEAIKVMVVASATGPLDYSEVFDVVQARAAALNEEGGVNGQPVEIVTCDDKFDINAATACGRQAVDEGVVADVQGFSIFGDAVIPLLEAAGIADIGASALSIADATNPVSFKLSGGAVSSGAAGGRFAADSGCTKAAVLAGQQPAAQIGVDYFTQVFEAAGGEVVAEERLSSGTGANPDFTAVVAKFASADAECAWLFVTPTEAGQFVGANVQSGNPLPVFSNTSTIPSAVRDQLGEALDGTTYSATNAQPDIDEDDPNIMQMRDDLEAYGSDAVVTPTGFAAWAAADGLFQVMQTIDGEVTAEAVLAALNATSEFPNDAFGEVDLTTPTPVAGAERLFSLNVLRYLQSGTEVTREGDFYNVGEDIS
jgi:ABC-type branched-subunit amino acid transport system substrate-binding protein